MADDKEKQTLVKLVSKGLTAVRKHFMEIKVLTEQKDPLYRDVDALLMEAQKLDANFRKIEKKLSSSGDKERTAQVKLVSKTLTALRKNCMEIKILTDRKDPNFKDLDALALGAQKLDADFRKVEKKL